jgi:hypothetical protein
MVLREVGSVLLQELKPTRESIVGPLRLPVTLVIAQEVADAFNDDNRTSLCSPDPPFDVLTRSESLIEQRRDVPFQRHLPNVRDRTLKETSGRISLASGPPRDVGPIGKRRPPTDGDRGLGEPFERDLEPIVGEEIVIIQERHVCAARGSQPRVAGSGRTPGARASDHTNPWVDRPLGAGGTVLDDDALEIRDTLTQHRIDGLAKELLSSDRWHNDAEQWTILKADVWDDR